MLTGLNHLTLTTGDLDRSLAFYVDLLGARPRVRWAGGAYLTLGEVWLCLSCDIPQPAQDYSHVAFTIAPEQFAHFCERLRRAGVTEWKHNRSEGDSLYLQDPDGHRLEIHVGDLASRLASLAQQPYEELLWLDHTPSTTT
ncbi:fosfomycin resistance glutathione transferase [Aeromonas cavernicola]|uniref:Glutathione transferase n=1 Tax=Aeromonas cavernicola TaxID=1006623 RepID=A0A2H9U685_9GAMM|nr:fosfomycin resistance glutathione transferase [Aeromonas cavernicola]PJG59566.1 glutathione transferase [Aeromonas cavernicola]